MIKDQIHQEHITILNVYESNVRASKCEKQKLMNWKKK